MWNGSEDICQECLAEAIAQKIPPLQRRIATADCPIHGHPAKLPPRLTSWLDLFNRIAPYCQGVTLDHILLATMCKDADIQFLEAFDWCTVILEAVNERDQGAQKSKKANAGPK